MRRSDGKTTEPLPGPKDQDFYIGLNLTNRFYDKN